MGKFKILMFGPAYGHNIKPFLHYFQTHSNKYSLTFVYSGKDDFAKSDEFKNIRFLKLSKHISALWLLYKTLKKDYHLIWHHGAYNILELFFVHLFKTSKSYFTINIWGEKIPHIANEASFRGRIYNYIFKRANKIQLNWFGTEILMQKIVSKDKTIVFPWGLDAAYFRNTKFEPTADFSKNFIEKLPNDKIKFFYPKSISAASDHLSLIEACHILNQQENKNFIVYFWLGNVNDKVLEQKYLEKITEYKLQDIVKIVKHPFLPFEDIIAIWEKMNAGLQIAINDQFSTTVLEPLLFKKELLITNIFPYQKLNELHPSLQLKLCERNAQKIADEMECIISMKSDISDDVLEARRQVVLKHFVFENNLKRMLDYYKNKTDFVNE